MRVYTGAKKNEKGLTLIEMLIAILIFILATVFIVSLVSNALDKPKVAGIQGDLKHYEDTARLVLNTATGLAGEKSSKELAITQYINEDLGGKEGFKGDKSTHVNAYGNNYNLNVEVDVGDDKQKIVTIQTTGNKEEYKVIIIEQGGVVDSCTVGFGRNDKPLTVLKSNLCVSVGGVVGEEEEEEEELEIAGVLSGLPKGTEVTFAGKKFLLLEPATGYMIMNAGQVEDSVFDDRGHTTYDLTYPGNLGHKLNTVYYNTLSGKEKAAIVESNYDMRDTGGAGGTNNIRANIGMLTAIQYGSNHPILSVEPRPYWTISRSSSVSVNTIQRTIMRSMYADGSSFGSGPISEYAVRPTMYIKPDTGVSIDNVLVLP